MKVSVKEFYERMYGDSQEERPKLPLLYRSLRRFETNRYQLAYEAAPGGGSALDIGCGDGELLMLLRNKYREIWGVDIAESRIDRTRSTLGNDPSFHLSAGDANEQLGFEDDSFDTITVIAVLEHVFDPFQFVRECHRLLRSGGTLIIEVPNVARLPNRIGLLLGRLPMTSDGPGWDGGHLHYFTRPSLKNLLGSGGFRVTRMTCGGILPRMRRPWGSLLGPDILVVGTKE